LSAGSLYCGTDVRLRSATIVAPGSRDAAIEGA
jgi:hypothetical protein